MSRRLSMAEIDHILDLLAEDEDGPAEKKQGEAGGDGGGARGPWLVRGIPVHVGDRRFRGFLGAVLDRIRSGLPNKCAPGR